MSLFTNLEMSYIAIVNGVFDPDGTISIKHFGQPLTPSVFDKLLNVDQAAIVDNKRLSAVLAFAKRSKAKQSKAKTIEKTLRNEHEVKETLAGRHNNEP